MSGSAVPPRHPTPGRHLAHKKSLRSGLSPRTDTTTTAHLRPALSHVGPLLKMVAQRCEHRQRGQLLTGDSHPHLYSFLLCHWIYALHGKNDLIPLEACYLARHSGARL